MDVERGPGRTDRRLRNVKLGLAIIPLGIVHTLPFPQTPPTRLCLARLYVRSILSIWNDRVAETFVAVGARASAVRAFGAHDAEVRHERGVMVCEAKVSLLKLNVNVARKVVAEGKRGRKGAVPYLKGLFTRALRTHGRATRARNR